MLNYTHPHLSTPSAAFCEAYALAKVVDVSLDHEGTKWGRSSLYCLASGFFLSIGGGVISPLLWLFAGCMLSWYLFEFAFNLQIVCVCSEAASRAFLDPASISSWAGVCSTGGLGNRTGVFCRLKEPGQAAVAKLPWEG